MGWIGKVLRTGRVAEPAGPTPSGSVPGWWPPHATLMRSS